MLESPSFSEKVPPKKDMPLSGKVSFRNEEWTPSRKTSRLDDKESRLMTKEEYSNLIFALPENGKCDETERNRWALELMMRENGMDYGDLELGTKENPNRAKIESVRSLIREFVPIALGTTGSAEKLRKQFYGENIKKIARQDQLAA